MSDHDGGIDAAGATRQARHAQRGDGFDGLPVDTDVTPDDRSLATSDGGPSAPGTVAAPTTQPRIPPRGRARARYLSGRVRGVITNRWDILAVIAAGGAIGSLARWQLSQRLPHPAGTFPWATFDTNATGCLLLGVLMVFVTDVWPPSRYLRPFLGVGVLGGFTTFSTYMLDARGLLVTGHTATAGAYLFGSLAAGLVAVWVGVTAARLAVRTAQRRRLRRLRRQAQVRASNRTTTTTSTSITPTSTTRSPR